MKKISVILYIFVLMLIAPTVYAGTAYVDGITIDANINQDGTMTVVETITWDIEERLNGVYRDILIENYSNKLNSASSIVINDVTVNGQRFNYSSTTLQNGTNGMYNVHDINGGKQIKIFTPSEDEYKTTIITYTLYDVVVKYNDIAELYWNFIGDGWNYGIDAVNIRITLPGNSKILKIFGHGPLNGYSEIINTDSVKLSVNNLRSKEQVDVRVLFDSSLVTPTKVINENKIEEILIEEARLAEQANKERELVKKAIYFSGVLIVIGLVIPIVVYIKAKRKIPKAEFKGKYYREVPEDYGPAIMNKVLYPTTGLSSSYDMLATILDLVRKKYVEIEPLKKEGKTKPYDYNLKLIKQDLSELNESEQYFIQNLIFVDTSNITLKELTKKNSKTIKDKEHAYEQYTEWTKIISKLAKQKDLLKKEKVRIGKDISKCLIGTLFVILVLVYGTIENYEDIMAAGMFGLFINTIELIAISISLQQKRTRTKKGIEHNAMWLAFKKFLLDFSRLGEHEYKSIAIWEHYLVYATALGISKQVIKELKLMYPTEFTKDSPTLSTYATISLLSDGSAFSSFTNAFTTATSTAFSSPSSNGRGGGFSGGAGGRWRRWRWRRILVS